MLRSAFFAAALLVCASVAGPAHAGLILITGNVPGDLENILFNETGLVSTGLTVTGITSETDLLVSFTEDSETIETPSRGQAKIASATIDGAFNSLLFQALDPLMVFMLFEANVNVIGTPTLRITATGSETVSFDLTAGNGQNRFGVVAETNDDFITSILIQTLMGNAITDVRHVRVGALGLSGEDDVDSLLSAPEPGSLVLFGSGLLAIGWVARRRMS